MPCKVCCVKGCNNSSELTPNKRFFFIPNNKEQKFKSWISFSQNHLLIVQPQGLLFDAYICGDHFKNDDFCDSTRKKLKLHAVPTVRRPLGVSKILSSTKYGSASVTEEPMTEIQPSAELVDLTSDDDVTGADISPSDKIDNQLEEAVMLDHSYHTMMGLTNPTLHQFCRVCGKDTDSYALISIFSDRGLRLEIAKKIVTHLDIAISKNDGLPQQICCSCVCHLNICHTLLQLSQEADDKLHHIFQIDKEKKQISVDALKENILPIEEENPFFIDCQTASKTESTLQEVRFLDNNLLRLEKDLFVENNFEDYLLTDEAFEEHPAEEDGLQGDSVETNWGDDLVKEVVFVNDPFDEEVTRDDVIEEVVLEDSLEMLDCVTLEEEEVRNDSFEEQMETVQSDEEDLENDPFENEGSKNYYFKKNTCEVQCTSDQVKRNKVVEKIKTFLCDECGKAFHDFEKFRTHYMKEHVGGSTKTKRKHSCKKCRRDFVHRASLIEHTNIHKDIRPYKCSECDLAFHTENRFTRHRKRHETGFATYACDTCGSKFDTLNKLKNHTTTKHIKVYVCQHCDTVFSKYKSYLAHRALHSREKEKLKEANERLTEEKKEVRSGHPLRSGKKCPNRQFSTHSVRSDQSRSPEKNGNNPKTYSCDTCEETFVDWIKFQSHKMTHILDKFKKEKFPCSLCTKSFETRRLLSDHMNVHSGILPYNCLLCDKSFYNHKHLREHFLTHSTQLQPCQACGQKFQTSEHLKTHMKRHKEAVLHTCTVCDGDFTTWKSFLQHIQVHPQVKKQK